MMFEWLGSLKVSERSAGRCVLRLGRTTKLAGLALLVVGLALCVQAWAIRPSLVAIPAGIAVLGLILVTLQRELVLDRQAGVLRVEQSFLGVSTRAVVPLFHLRAVVVTARASDGRARPGKPKYVAYLDRRIGESIYLDEARRCAGLLKLAEALADVGELQLEYEASDL